MNNHCPKQKDQLLEAALTQTVAPELQAHLLMCPLCTAELSALRARRERLDALLPLVAQEVELSPDFRTRVLAAVESAGDARRHAPWRILALAAASAVVLAALLTYTLRLRNSPPAPQADLVAAQKLAAWRAPSDIFLETPGRDFLRNTPKLGASYLPIPAQTHKEK